jgi:hypothetical protein
MATVPMRTQLIKITTQPVKKRPSILATSIRALLVALSLFVATSTPKLRVGTGQISEGARLFHYTFIFCSV